MIRNFKIVLNVVYGAIYVLVFLLLFGGCHRNVPATVTDVDGNVYHTVTIGSQVWMAENLKVTRYRNGDPIPKIISNINWSSAKTGAYCNYNNEDTNAFVYGHLYNWYTLNDDRALAPQGWHVPNSKEIKTLINFLGGQNVAGANLKESGTTHWLTPNSGATNKFGYTALPSGYRNSFNGNYHLIGRNGFWWFYNEKDTSAWINVISFNDSCLFRNYIDKSSGISVRCVKD